MPGNDLDVKRINAALDYMETHLADAPPLDRVAQAAHCSKFHFHRLFTRYAGMRLALNRPCNEKRDHDLDR